MQKYTPQKGDIIFDCGAFCGAFTHFFSELIGESGRVYAFEPDEICYQALITNIKINNISNVIAVKKGIYSSTTTLNFFQKENESSAIADSKQNNTTTIQVLSLEDAYREFNLPKLDYVKMDIEGAELEAVLASKAFLADKKIHFAIASYHYRNGEQTFKALEEFFSEIGYSYETGYTQHLTTCAWKD
jgi:FkbM family methyltransferase